MKKGYYKYFLRLEFIFVFLAILNIWPIWFSNYFPTVDGASHLYNSQLILELGQSNSFFQNFHEINPEWLPNWSGHLILLIFQKMGIPVFLANKLLLSLIALGIPLAFKGLLKEMRIPLSGISFFSLVLVYTFLFGLGFYNFGLGILGFFIALRLLIRAKNQINFKNLLFLFLSISFTYFSHLVCFGILGIYFVLDFILGFLKKDDSFTLPKGLLLSALFLPFVVLAFLFLFDREAPDVESYFGAATLWYLLTKLKILVLYFGKTEFFLAQIVFYSLITIWLFSLRRFRNFKAFEGRFQLLFILFIILFFSMPDASSNGSFISRRILIFAFWILLIALSNFKIHKFLNMGIIILVIGIQFIRTHDYFLEIKAQDQRVSKFLEISDLVDDHSIVLDIHHAEGFKERHFSSYLALNRDILILDNYEANYAYFPIKWKQDFPKIDLFNSKGLNKDCIIWNSNLESSTEYQIDYVFIQGGKEMNSCQKEIFSYVKENYSLLYPKDSIVDNAHLSLYKRKNSANKFHKY